MVQEKLTTDTDVLFVKLTEPELRERGTRLAGLLCELRDLDREEQTFKERLKEKRKGLEPEVQHLADAIHHGQELRPVTVHEVARWSDGEVDRIREDTGEVVSTRKLEPHERQAGLFQGPPRNRKRAEETAP
jgi:hypothetical protein